MSYAVVACNRCQQAWSIELRHQTTTCPRCNTKVDVARRRRLWSGDDPVDARDAAGAINAALAQGRTIEDAPRVAAMLSPEPLPRHDSPTDAAAARGRDIINAGRRAEEVARSLYRLDGPMLQDDLIEALCKAGLDEGRAEAEIVRMMATDFLFEPRPAQYACLD